MMNEKDLENKALSDDELDSVSGGMRQVQPLVYKGEEKKAGSTVQRGKAGKGKSLVYKDEKKSFDGMLLSGGFDGPTYT